MGGTDKTFLEHLEVLRSTIISCFAVLVVTYPLGYFLTPLVIKWMIKWCFPDNLGILHYFGPMDVFALKMQMALVIALVLGFPWFIYQIWKFLLPALYKNERRMLLVGIFFSTLLFALGVTFSVTVMLPMAMNFAGSFATTELQPMLGVRNFVTLAGWFMLAFGVMFQTPAVVLLAVKLGVVTSAQLCDKRPYVLTGILIVSAILTPPDVISQLMLAVPTWLLFEGGLKIASYIEKKSVKPAFKESMN